MNTSKLLPPSKYTSTADRMAAAYDKKVDDVLSFKVKEKAIKVDKLLKNQLIQDKKRKKKKDIKKEQEKFNLRETLLETKKLTKGMRGIKLPSIPKMSFLDSIRNFITFTLLGIVANQLFKYLPQLTDITKKMIGIIGTVGGFFEGIAKGLLNGFATFIHEGYKLRDGFKDFIGKKFGDNAAKQFEELEKKLNLFFDLSLLTGLLSLDIAMDLNRMRDRDRIGSGKTGFGKFGVDKFGRRLTPQELKDLNLKPGSVEARSIQKSGTKAQRAAGLQQRKIEGKKIREGIAAPPSAAPKLEGPFAKLKKSFSRFAGVAVPGLGAVIGAADAAARFKSGDKFGGTLASISALLDTGVAASALTGIGLPIAGVLATISMSIDVLLLLRDILSIFGVPNQILGFSRGGKIIRRYQDGGSTRGGKPVSGQITRTVKPVERKEIPVKPQKSQPGKDIGGRKEIQKLFPDPMSPTGPDVKSDPDAINPLRTLETTSKILKTIPFLGGVMGSAIDISMGERPNKQIFKSFGGAVGSLIQDVADNQISLSLSDVSKSISAMANGGQVKSANLLKENNIGYQIGSLVAKVFEGMIDSRVNEIFQELKKQFKKSQEDTGPTGEGGGAGGYATGAENFVSSKEVYDYLKSKGLSQNHILGILANIQAESSFNAGAIGDSGTSGGLFQHHKERFSGMVSFAGKDWAKNWKKQIDYALREEPGKQYVSKEFKSAQEASAWFTLNFERPANKEQKARERLDNLKNFGPDGSWIGDRRTDQLKRMDMKLPPGGFNVVEYITGDPNTTVGRFDKSGHGTEENYHDHIAFKTKEDKERAKSALRAAGIQIGSEYRQTGGYHSQGLAIDIPGNQWGGTGKIGQREYSGSAKVRRVLGLKDGGVIGPSIPKNIAPIKTYASYDSESQVIMMIQPVHYYTNTSKKSVSFPGVVVNNNSSRSNSTFFRQ